MGVGGAGRQVGGGGPSGVMFQRRETPGAVLVEYGTGFSPIAAGRRGAIDPGLDQPSIP